MTRKAGAKRATQRPECDVDEDRQQDGAESMKNVIRLTSILGIMSVGVYASAAQGWQPMTGKVDSIAGRLAIGNLPNGSGGNEVFRFVGNAWLQQNPAAALHITSDENGVAWAVNALHGIYFQTAAGGGFSQFPTGTHAFVSVAVGNPYPFVESRS
jgi:hypothetical protein